MNIIKFILNMKHEIDTTIKLLDNIEKEWRYNILERFCDRYSTDEEKDEQSSKDLPYR